jgi:hypothetical protein
MIRSWYCSMRVRFRQSRRNRSRERCPPYLPAEQLATNPFLPRQRQASARRFLKLTRDQFSQLASG